MRGALIFASVMVVGCGRISFSAGDDALVDAGPDAPSVTPGDVNGYWRSVSITDYDTGEIFTPGTNGTSRHSTIDIALPDGRARFLFVADDLVLYEEAEQLVVTITATHWVFDNPLEATRNAYVPTWRAADAVELEYDATYPGSTGDPLAQHYSIRRGARPDPTLVGTWQIAAAGYPGGTVEPAGNCTPYPTGSVQLVGTFTIDSDLLFSVDANVGRFSTPDCTGVAELLLYRSDYGYVESEGSSFDLWTQLVGLVKQSRGSFTFEEDVLVLSSSSCWPVGDCELFPQTMRATRL